MIRAALIALVKGYRLLLSPWLGSTCRFTPTCSAYSLQALERHGAGAGTYLTLGRLVRCHPWCDGGHDPVPETVAAPRFLTPACSHPYPRRSLHERHSPHHPVGDLWFFHGAAVGPVADL